MHIHTDRHTLMEVKSILPFARSTVNSGMALQWWPMRKYLETINKCKKFNSFQNNIAQLHFTLGTAELR